MKYQIQVEVDAVHGIAVFDENMMLSKSQGQVSCVVGLSRNRCGMKSSPSLPLRRRHRQSGNAHDYDTGFSAKWPRNTEKLILDTKLNNHKQKTFEVSVMLSRGSEQILVGIASLKFISTVLETEIDIPIHLISSTRAVQILHSSKTRGRTTFLGRNEVRDSFFQSNPYTINNGIRTVSFKGGDSKRKYALNKGAYINLKCSCIPTQKVNLTHFQSLLNEKNRIALNAFQPPPMNTSMSDSRTINSHGTLKTIEEHFSSKTSKSSRCISSDQQHDQKALLIATNDVQTPAIIERYEESRGCDQDPDNLSQDPESRIQDPESRIQDPESRITQDPENRGRSLVPPISVTELPTELPPTSDHKTWNDVFLSINERMTSLQNSIQCSDSWSQIQCDAKPTDNHPIPSIVSMANSDSFDISELASLSNPVKKKLSVEIDPTQDDKENVPFTLFSPQNVPFPLFSPKMINSASAAYIERMRHAAKPNKKTVMKQKSWKDTEETSSQQKQESIIPESDFSATQELRVGSAISATIENIIGMLPSRKLTSSTSDNESSDNNSERNQQIQKRPSHDTSASGRVTMINKDGLSQKNRRIENADSFTLASSRRPTKIEVKSVSDSPSCESSSCKKLEEEGNNTFSLKTGQECLRSLGKSTLRSLLGVDKKIANKSCENNQGDESSERSQQEIKSNNSTTNLITSIRIKSGDDVTSNSASHADDILSCNKSKHIDSEKVSNIRNIKSANSSYSEKEAHIRNLNIVTSSSATSHNSVLNDKYQASRQKEGLCQQQSFNTTALGSMLGVDVSQINRNFGSNNRIIHSSSSDKYTIMSRSQEENYDARNHCKKGVHSQEQMSRKSGAHSISKDDSILDSSRYAVSITKDSVCEMSRVSASGIGDVVLDNSTKSSSVGFDFSETPSSSSYSSGGTYTIYSEENTASQSISSRNKDQSMWRFVF